MTLNRDKIWFTLTAIVVIIYLVCFIGYLWKHDSRTVIYNCDMSEISPDFPLQVKEQCRKLRSGRI